MTPPILLQDFETPCKEQCKDEDLYASRPVFFEEINEMTPLKKLLNLCKENISKKILEEKQLEKPIDFFSDLELFLEETESDLSPKNQPSPKKKKAENSIFTVPEIPIIFLKPHLELSQGVSSSVSLISQESLLLFDKMCSEILVMSSEACSKTIITLQSQEFIHSPFYGAEITLEEFSTAPKTFNVIIKTNESAINLIQSQIAGFMQLLEDRNFSFGINRIDTSIETEPFLSKELKRSKKNQDKFSLLGEDSKDERS